MHLIFTWKESTLSFSREKCLVFDSEVNGLSKHYLVWQAVSGAFWSFRDVLSRGGGGAGRGELQLVFGSNVRHAGPALAFTGPACRCGLAVFFTTFSPGTTLALLRAADGGVHFCSLSVSVPLFLEHVSSAAAWGAGCCGRCAPPPRASLAAALMSITPLKGC